MPFKQTLSLTILEKVFQIVQGSEIDFKQSLVARVFSRQSPAYTIENFVKNVSNKTQNNLNSAQPQLIIKTIALLKIVNTVYICENDMAPMKDMFQIVATWLQFSSEEYSYSKVSNYTKLEDCAALKVLREL